jgi:hypothetical protein
MVVPGASDGRAPVERRGSEQWGQWRDMTALGAHAARDRGRRGIDMWARVETAAGEQVPTE